MHVVTINYTDFDGNERKKDAYFNISKSEAVKLQMSSSGGLTEYLKKIIDDQSWERMSEWFEKFILFAYGEKSLDGDRFMKSEEISRAFKETNAYDKLFTRLTTDDKYASEFFNAIIPKDLPTAQADKSVKPSLETNSPVSFPTL